MFSKAFRSTRKYYWVTQGAGIAWLLGVFFLLRFYKVEILIALTDASVLSALFVGMVWILDKVFTFYNPKDRILSTMFILPLVLTFLITLAHQGILGWIFSDESVYLSFLREHFYLRWAVLGLAGVMISLLAGVVSQLEQEEELKNRELHLVELSKEAELSQLRQQLQPHFLFNSLNSISSLVMDQPEQAREMVLLLSDFLRGTIRKELNSWVNLREELDYLKMYLEIERVRFGHRMDVLFEVDPEVGEMKIPQLLLQPLLENSIKHGLYGVTGQVQILLKAEKSQNYLVIQIDNPTDPDQSPQAGTGFGLKSLERRLFLLFGRTDLLVKRAEDKKFSVILKIPQHK